MYVCGVKLKEGQIITAKKGGVTITGEITAISYHHSDKSKIVGIFIDEEYINPKDIITNPRGAGRKKTGHQNGRRTIYTHLPTMDALKEALGGRRDSWITETIQAAGKQQGHLK